MEPAMTGTGETREGATTGALRTERDFRQVVVDYAAEAASHGAVYLEGIFTPAEPAGRGCDWDEVFTGYCDGAQQAAEQHGVKVRLTPDIPRSYPLGPGQPARGSDPARHPGCRRPWRVVRRADQERTAADRRGLRLGRDRGLTAPGQER
jgi:Adenosine deaminase